MPRVVVLEGSQRGTSFRLIPAVNTLGREGTAEVALSDDGISRIHAEISLGDDGRYVLADKGSKNGTALNGVRLEAPHSLAVGDEIRVGGSCLVFLDDMEPPGETATISALSAERPRALVGESAAIRRVASQIARCAPLESTILVTGESGTGKELVAQALHRLSPRRRDPFVALNSAALDTALLESDLYGHEKGAFTGAVARRLGKLELAGSGTLFLDEIGELPPSAQAKLLRVLETRRFERLGGRETLTAKARLVVATHRDLKKLVEEGTFRADLLFRLRVVEIALPPLRERREDLPLLVEQFVSELAPRIGSRARSFSSDALERLRRYAFPGNVRELRNLVERCLIFAEDSEVGVHDLPGEVQAADIAEPSGQPARTLAQVERAHIAQVLAETAWNKVRAAEALGIDRTTLYAKIKRYGLTP